MAKRRKKRVRIKLRAWILLFIIIAVVFGACSLGGGDGSDDSGETRNNSVQQEKESAVNLKILCVGDIMAHSPNIKSAYDPASETYDFSDNYDYVSDYISEADLALCNVETTFGGGTPTGYPLFNAPDNLAADIAEAGFDVAITANNHMADTGFNGIQRTLQVLREQGLTTVGSRLAGEERFAIRDVKGVKVGIVAYTYETSQGAGSSVSINGNRVSAEAAELINSFNYYELETEDLAKIRQDINGARNAGAEIVVCYFHWGEEYMREPTSYQFEMAQDVADMGADIIFASHPHVLQEVDVVTSSSGERVPVFYSMGNFISNQRTETLSSVSNRKYTEQGMMASVELEYMKSTGEILSETLTVIPTWVDRYGSSVEYRIIPLDRNLNSNETLAASGHLSRASDALEDIRVLVGDEYLRGKTVLMGETVDESTNESTGESAGEPTDGAVDESADWRTDEAA